MKIDTDIKAVTFFDEPVEVYDPTVGGTVVFYAQPITFAEIQEKEAVAKVLMQNPIPAWDESPTTDEALRVAESARATASERRRRDDLDAALNPDRR